MKYIFAETPDFTERVHDYFGNDAEFARFQSFLAEDPLRGTVIRGTGGIRKIRWEDVSRRKGKRSGLRIAYLFVPSHARILLLEAYGKNERDDMSAQEKRLIKSLAEEYRRRLNEGGRLR